MDNGRYKMILGNVEYDVVIETRMTGEYPDKEEKRFVCIPGYFPIPLDSWIIENAEFFPPPRSGPQSL